MARRTIGFVAAVVWLLTSMSSMSWGQVIYAPAVFQHEAGERVYYYGGSNPAVIERAQYLTHSQTYGRVNGWAFASTSIDTHREVSTEPARIYTDAMPFAEARVYGFTATDAQNEAAMNQPTYFRKGDLLASGVRQADGTVVVPPTAAGYVSAPAATPVMHPTTRPGAILIIPLPKGATEGKQVASAR